MTSPGPSAAASAPAPPQVQSITGIDALGSLTDPLPQLVAASGVADAKALARRVLAGTSDSLPALVTALQASGIAISGPNDELIVRPAEPWQGIVIEWWEVRLLAVSALPERTVSMTLGDLGDDLRAITPELKNIAFEKLLASDLRALAAGPASPKQFWAAFVMELGRSSRMVEAQDIASSSDPASVRINGLQAALILRRLATDFSMRADSQKSGGMPHALTAVTPQRSAENLPCTMNSTEKTILDFAAFGAKVGMSGLRIGEFGFGGLMGAIGLNQSLGAQLFRSLASAALQVIRVWATYAALEVKVGMDSPPLIRTKQVRPVSGEQKELTATVRMNTGNAQILNCFRIMLNSIGLDFKLTQDGPVKNAHLGWQGSSGFSELVEQRGGPAQFVRFVGDPAARVQSGGQVTAINPIINAVTDAKGQTSVAVEGVGQRIKKAANAVRVIKHASVYVTVAVKGSDFLGDVTSAAISATGGAKAIQGLIVEMLFRSQWASAGFYTFDVVDWSGSQWTGTLKQTQTMVTHRVAGRLTDDATTISSVKVDVKTTTQYDISGDETTATMTGTAEGAYSQEGTHLAAVTTSSCGKDWNWVDSAQETSHGSASGNAEITVSTNGVDYDINAVPIPTVQMAVTGEILEQRHQLRLPAGAASCALIIETLSRSLPITQELPVTGIKVKAVVDPDDPDRLAGTTITSKDNGNGTVTTTTVEWDLERD